MKFPEGVFASVYIDEYEGPVEIADDGFVGRLKPGHASIVVQIAPGEPILGLVVDGKKNVDLKKNWCDDPGEGSLYRQIVSILKSGHGVPFTQYTQNHLRLLQYDMAGGEVSLWEIALISQNGNFFLTAQETYKFSCYVDDQGWVVCPKFQDNWPQMSEFLVEFFEEFGAGLRPAKEYQAEPEVAASGLGSNMGRVMWWNAAQGLGAVMTQQGAARVHWSEIPGRPRLAWLEAGEVVSFARMRKPEASLHRPTNFQWELLGVRTP